MKFGKTFSLSTEILEKVEKEENASELIERLLRSYYYDKNFQTQSLEEQLKRAELIENEIIMQKEIERKKIADEIEILKQREKEISDKQKQSLEENITLLETQPQLCNELVETIRQKGWNMDLILDFVEKFRQVKLRVGTYQIKQYLNSKGIFERSMQETETKQSEL